MNMMLSARLKSAAADNKPTSALTSFREADAGFGPLFRSGFTNNPVYPVNPVR